MNIKERAEKLMTTLGTIHDEWFNNTNIPIEAYDASRLAAVTVEIEAAISEERAKLARAAYALTEIAKMSERLIGGGQIMVMANTILEEIQPPKAEG